MKASAYQKRFWFEWKTDPLSAQYNEFFVYDIKGYLDTASLEKAFRYLSYKHPMLRSQYYYHDDELYLEIIADMVLPFNIINVGQAQKAVVESEALKIINKPFDLGCGPLWRANLLKLNDKNFWLLISLHHIIIDGNSFEILRNDLSFFYNKNHNYELCNAIKKIGRKNILLNEYLKKESENLSCFLNDSELGYYKEKLTDASLYHDFHAGSFSDKFCQTKNIEGEDVGDPIFHSAVSALKKQVETKITDINFSLGQVLVEKISDFCFENRCSLFQFIAAIFSVFLYKCFENEKTCFVYPVNMRPSTHKDMFGSFINMQILPINFEKNSSFLKILSQINENRQMARLINLPYEKIIFELKKNGVVEAIDWANVILAETDLKLRPLNLDGLESTNVFFDKNSLPYDLSLEYQYLNENIFFRFMLNDKKIMPGCSNNNLKDHFIAIIKHVLSNIDLSLMELSLVSPDQAKSMMPLSIRPEEFNAVDIRIEKKFEKIVCEYSDKIAIIDNGIENTYLQLNQLADTIAKNLEEKLSPDEKLIGVSMTHSLELVATIIALFKLGRAYLPLRTDLPDSYLDEIIKQSKISTILKDKTAINLCPVLRCNVFFISDLIAEKDNLSISKNRHKFDNLAYVLYTSGTSGKPKGVAIEHHSIVNLVSSCQSFFNISYHDIIPWFHSYSFDFSVWEIWAALLNGASLLILDSSAIKSPRVFTEHVEQYKATIINQTPTALKQWGGYLATVKETKNILASVRIIITGGETLCHHHVEKIYENRLNFKIFNMYGITEDCIHSTICEITVDYFTEHVSNIGKMLPGKKALVVDKNLNLKPLGCPGNLIISGFGLAREYFNQPVLTQENFFKLPGFSGEVIWFKTGDNVRILPSGEIEYLGRKDAQVKIRGYRIDCNDIEIRVRHIDGVSDVKILVHNNEFLSLLVLEENVAVEDIHKMIKLNLPYYMVPERFIKIEEIPLTVNGKIDIERLIQKSQITTEKKQAQPTVFFDTVTTEIRKIWAALLPGQCFDLDDNFFDSGGNSVLLASLQQKLECFFEINLSILEFFTHPTISDMANMVKKKKFSKMEFSKIL